MKTLKSLFTLAGLATLPFMLSCDNPSGLPKSYNSEYNLNVENSQTNSVSQKQGTNQVSQTESNTEFLDDKIIEINGRIIKTQQSVISAVYDRGNQDGRGITHEIEWVLVDGATNRQLTLIYPYMKVIQEKFATIKYRALKEGKVTAEQFTKGFISNKYHAGSDDNITIEADGIIIRNGIEYK